MSQKIAAWVKAFRLRTLVLSLSCIGMGSFLAASISNFKPAVLIWSLLTTIFLQVLSNLANDYGDSIHGADSDMRQGPSRAVQSGLITKKEMKRAIVLTSVLALISGVILLIQALSPGLTFWIFLVLGIVCIAAAIFYTMGKNPYGYAGLGDLSVFIFFGWVGVLGSFYLHTSFLDWDILLPSSACSFFAVAVLNINNIRDIQSDRIAGKRSIPVRIGRTAAVKYHFFLLIGGIISAGLYVLLHYKGPWQWLFLMTLPLLVLNAKAVYQITDPKVLDPYLKQMALTTFLFVLFYGLGELLA